MRIFVDIDGTLNKWRPAATRDDLYRPGFYSEAEPQWNILLAVKLLVLLGHEVFAISAYLDDCPEAVEEKQEWLDRFIPQIDKEHRLFPRCSESKVAAARRKGINVFPNDILLDDYSKNLLEWPGTPVKVINGFNGKGRLFKGRRVNAAEDPNKIITDLL